MVSYDLPLSIKNGENTLKIRNKCDYRIVLKCINALKDDELTDAQKIECALIIFYENHKDIVDVDGAVKEMLRIIGYDEEPKQDTNKPVLMDWDFDFKQIAPPISRVLGYSVRDAQRYTHWYDFVGAYMEIGECSWSTIITIREKKARHQKLEKWEEEFCREHSDLVNLPIKYSQEEEELFSLFEKKGES